LHAPNHREFKGTKYIELAIRELQSEGVLIELILVERVANKVAIEIYKKADIVVDQVMVGYHGYFALEAMALGKPVMCFIRDRQRYLYKPDQCPLIDVSVSTLKESLRSWAGADQGQLDVVGRASRCYVEENYSLEAFAQRLKVAYQDLGVMV
jgi:glycosyltransferase involved in cell wall biosynthesis